MLSAQMNEGSDASDNTSTSYSIDVDDTFSGNISSGTDQDWIAVNLIAGTSYTFNTWGTGGTSAGVDDTIQNLRDNAGTVIQKNDDISPGQNMFSGIEFMATVTRT